MFDGLLSVLAMVGMWPVLRLLFQYDSPNPIERRLRIILASMFIFSLFRIPYVAFNFSRLGGVVYGLGIVVMFQVFLFFETLLRRHMPIGLKIWVSIGGLFFGIASFTGHLADRAPMLRAFGMFLVLTQFWTMMVAVWRPRRDYSPDENRFIDICLVSLLFLAPFFITDISIFELEPIPKMGVVGILLFTFISIHSESIFHRKAATFRSISTALIASGFLTFMTNVLIPGLGPGITYRLLVLMFSINLVARIFDAIRHLDGKEPASRFVGRLLESDKRDRTRFLMGLNRFFEDIDKKVLRPQDLLDCNIDLLNRIFDDKQTSTFSLYQLRQILEEPELHTGDIATEIETIEQMIHLMEMHSMNHICRVDRGKATFVLLQVTAIGYSRQIRLQADLTTEIAGLIRP
jgi:hypothetical protein